MTPKPSSLDKKKQSTENALRAAISIVKAKIESKKSLEDHELKIAAIVTEQRRRRKRSKPWSIPAERRSKRPTLNQLLELAECARSIPNIIGRAVALSGLRRIGSQSAGHCEPGSFEPHGERTGQGARSSLQETCLDETSQDLAAHVAWKDKLRDPWISLTCSLVFMYMHGYLRSLKGGENIQFHLIDSRQATDEDGHSKDLYWALDLFRIFDVQFQEELIGNFITQNLHARKLNHEILTHSTILFPKSTHRAVTLTEIIDAGLFELFPHIEIPIGSVPAGKQVERLYRSLHFARTQKSFTEVQAFTLAEVDQVMACASLYCPRNTDDEDGGVRPHLQIVLLHGTGKMRGKGDVNKHLKDRIIAMGYTLNDLRDCLYPDYHKIPDNLPEQKAWHNLVCDLNDELGGPSQGHIITPIELIHEDPYSHQEFKAKDDEEARKYKLSRFRRRPSPAPRKRYKHAAEALAKRTDNNDNSNGVLPEDGEGYECDDVIS